MWRAFELMHETFKNGGELYLEGKEHCNNLSPTKGLPLIGWVL